MSTVGQYTKELYKQFHYYATWLPGTPVELGSIGVMKNKEFTKLSHLRNEGIEFGIDADTTKTDMDYASEKAITVKPKISGNMPVAGSVLSQVDAGFTVEFSRENSVLFKAKGSVSHSISNQIKLGQEIRKRIKEGRWEKNWVVISELVVADSTTILVSSSSKGKIELKAKANIGAAKLDIADAGLQLEVAFSRDLHTQMIAEQGATLLFKVRRSRGK
jgi:hypothetical protein